MVRSAEARAYIAAVKAVAIDAGWYANGPVAVTLHWHRSRKSGDLDNRAKVALDALNGMLWADDKQIVELHLFRHEAPRNGKLDLIVESYRD